LTVPLPVPELELVSQAALLVADQEHPAVAVTLTVPEPPTEKNVIEVEDRL
jgi:hypothetical protein